MAKSLRAPRPAERHLDVAALDMLHRESGGALEAAWHTESSLLISSAVSQVEQLSHIGQLDRLVLEPTESFVSHVHRTLRDTALEAARQMVAEAARQSVTLAPLTDNAADRASSQRADALSAILAEHVQTTAKARALALTQSALVSRVTPQVDRYLRKLTWRWPRDQLTAAVSASIHLGRVATMANRSEDVLRAAMDEATTYYASEILDGQTCDECEQIDGTQYDTFEDALADYPLGGYVNCLGGERCRGTIIAEYPPMAGGAAGAVTRPLPPGARYADPETQIPEALARLDGPWLREFDQRLDAMKVGAWNVNTTEQLLAPEGQWVNDRRLYHSEAAKRFMQGNPTRAEGEREALYTAGGPAAGKSEMTRSGDVPLPEGHVLINADAWKATLPEYRAMVRARDPRAAGKVHEESSQLAKQLTKMARAKGSNMVVDGVGGGDGKFVKELEASHRAGYKVKLAYATTDVNGAVERAAARGEKTGRFVDERVVREGHQKAAATFRDYVEPHTSYAFEIYDTTLRPPVLLANRVEGGATVVHDASGYARFLRRADGEP